MNTTLTIQPQTLKINGLYRTSSCLGGAFTIKYKGENKDGKHVFNVTNKGFTSLVFAVDTERLSTFLI